MRADLIDDLVIETARLQREAMVRKVRSMKAAQQGEAFKNLEK